MLYSQYYPAEILEEKQPTFVFLHGLLGNGYDWGNVIPLLNHYSCLTIDLCGHGRSRYKNCQGFDYICQLIESTVVHRLDKSTPIVFVGYSLGARIAMYAMAHKQWSTINVVAMVSEGGNFGLTTEKEKEIRWDHDQAWAKRFGSDSLEHVLDDWYQQTVFSSLRYEQRQDIIQIRSANLGVSIANMLLATSLAKQPHLLDKLKSQTVPILYVCGEKDAKFRKLASESGLHTQLIESAGHNAHKEQPTNFAQCIHSFIFKHVKVNDPL